MSTETKPATASATPRDSTAAAESETNLPMKTRIHMSIDVRGMMISLASSNKKDRKRAANLFTHNGEAATPEQVMKFLQDHLAQGHEVIPLRGQPCEGWSWKKGCPGHRPE